MLTGNQIRIARFALRWSTADLSKIANVSLRTLKRIEAENGVPTASAQSLHSLQTALETAGIEFIGTPDDRPGIRIGLPKPNDGSS